MEALKIVQKYFPEVTSVVDAKEPITVEVTALDSKKGTTRNHKACALAVACQKKENADGIIVSIATCYVIKNNKAVRYQVPENISREIVSFDRNAGFAPGEYKLNAPPKFLRLGAMHGSSSHAEDRNNPKRKRITRKHMTSGIRSVLGSREDG